MDARHYLKHLSKPYWALFVIFSLSFFFCDLWSMFTVKALGVDVDATLFSVFTILNAGFIVAPAMTAVYIITPVIALIFYFQGRQCRLVSQYLLWNWMGSLIAASCALYCFSSWEAIDVNLAPWNAISLFYELDHRTLIFNRWLICIIGCLIPVVVFNFLNKMSVNKRMKEAFGDAHFASVLEINKAKLFGKEGIVIGQAHGKILRVPGFESVLLAAPTGSGKTTSIAVPNLIEHQGSAIVNDLKGELYRLTAQYRSEQDNNTCYLFNPMDDDIQDFYNPFFYVREDTNKQVDDLLVIAKALIQENKLGDGFWYQASRELFILLSLYLIESKGNATLAEVHDLSKSPRLHKFLLGNLDEVNSKYSENLKERVGNFSVNGLPFTTEMLNQNAHSFAETPDETRLNVLKDFHSRLSFLMSLSIRNATSKNTFDFRKLRKEKMSIYVQIPQSDKELFSPLLTIFWAQVARHLTKNEPNMKDEPHAVLCLLDEFGMIGKIDTIRDSLSTLRSYRVRFLIIVQYLNQIVATYGRENSDSFFNNTKTKIYFSATNLQDAKMISETLGVKAVKIESRSVNAGSFTQSGHVTHSQNYQSVPLMRPGEMMSLDDKQSIIVVAGHSPIKAKKIYWFKNSHYKRALGK